MQFSRIFAMAVVLTAGCSLWAIESVAEVVGKAVSIRTVVTGARGELKRADPVSRDERIRTNNLGVGQFQFVDGTKLAVGPNSSIVIDEYVLGDRNRVRKLAINATKGTFRWISGRSPSSAYVITTPAGSLGVRGTAFDVAVSGDTAMLVLLNGAGEWCAGPGRRNCVIVDRPCQYIIAQRGRRPTDPQPVSLGAVNDFGAAAFPFLVDNRQLLPSFRLGRSNCGIANRIRSRSNDSRDPDDRPQGRQQDSGRDEGGGGGETPNGPVLE